MRHSLGQARSSSVIFLLHDRPPSLPRPAATFGHTASSVKPPRHIGIAALNVESSLRRRLAANPPKHAPGPSSDRASSLRDLWYAALIGVWASAGCGSLPSTKDLLGTERSTVVYGNDERTEVYESPSDALSKVARHSVLAVIPVGRLERQADGTWTVISATAAERNSLCPGERFSSQLAAAECSATLIDKDLVLTAGHCAGSASECAAYAYVFNYWYKAPGELATIDDNAVYGCRSRVVFELDMIGTAPIDIAVVELDRPVNDAFAPAAVAPGDGVPLGTQVALIGTGEGVPIKIDRGGFVQAYVGLPPTGFKSNVDAFLGASGSGLFSNDGALVGVLSSGQPDFLSTGDCARTHASASAQPGSRDDARGGIDTGPGGLRSGAARI